MIRIAPTLLALLLMLATPEAIAQYKTKQAFSSEKAYSKYVRSNLQQGMRVEANQDYYDINKGDQGTYYGTNEGNPPCLVEWDNYIGKNPTLLEGFPEDKKGYAYWVEWHMLNLLGGGGSGPIADVAINRSFRAQDEGSFTFSIPYSTPDMSNLKLVITGTDYDDDNDGDYTDFTISLNGTNLINTKTLNSVGMPGSGTGEAEFDVSGIAQKGSNTLIIKETEVEGQTDYAYLRHAKIYTAGTPSSRTSTASSGNYSSGGAYEEIISSHAINKKFTAQTTEDYSFYISSSSAIKDAYMVLNGTDYDYDNDGDYTDFTISVNGNDLINIQQLQAEGMGADGTYTDIAWDISSYIQSGSNSISIKQTEDQSQVDYAYIKSLNVIAGKSDNLQTGNLRKTINAPDVERAPQDLSIQEVSLTDKYAIFDISYSGTKNSCIMPGTYIKDKNSSRRYKIRKVQGVPYCREDVFKTTRNFKLYFEALPTSTATVDIIEPGTTGTSYSFYGVDISSSGSGQVAKHQKANKNEGAFSNDLPPILSIKDITFSDNVLQAEETAQLSITLKNSGPGDARDVYLNLSGYMQGLEFPSKAKFPTIPANGGSKTVKVDIKGGLDLPTSQATLTMEVVEPHFKVKIQGKQLKFPTKAYKKPDLILAKHAIVENQSANPNNQIDINEMIDLKLVVQNVGQGDAEQVSISVNNKQKGVMLLGVVQGQELKRQNPEFATLPSGKFKTVEYRYFVNSEFSAEKLQFTINANERIGKFGLSEQKSFPINTELEEEGYIRKVAARDNEARDKEVVIEDLPDLTVDVDTDIPATDGKRPHTYALIIGNEDYQSRQKGLTEEQNVDFAINDAQVFAHYCERTLGIPQKQIKLLKDATAAEMQQGLSWLSNLAHIEEGDAELIFYYSGHGLPDEETKEPYLIPVDVSGKSIKYALKLEDVYSQLTKHPVKQAAVFLDACFSGGGREQGLLAVKGVRIKPKSTSVNDRVVSFSSSTGNESSSVYREKHHGYFTYFLLKKLKETRGTATFGELTQYVTKKVRKETGLMGKIQNPSINVSPKVQDEWKSWTLK